MPIKKRKKSILTEAAQKVHGPRQDTYGHPYDTYTAMAGMVNALFAPKLLSPFTALNMIQVMMLLKHSRLRKGFHRDSFLDIAGFVACAEMVEEKTHNLKK